MSHPLTPELVRYLIKNLGPALTSTGGGALKIKDSELWGDESLEPTLDQEKRIKYLHTVYATVSSSESPVIASQWLTGYNRLLNEAPILAIRQDRFEDVHQALYAFLGSITPGRFKEMENPPFQTY